MAYTPAENFPELIESMKRAAAALRDADVPYMLGGGLAAWARGGPPTEHDVDFFVRPEDAERALEALVAAGMKHERPTEEWLLKAWDGETLIDLIFSPMGGSVDDGFFERAEEMEVAAQRLPVASLGDVLTTKLLALNEQDPDLGSVLELARSLREQIDWVFVRSQTTGSPFARAFFTLVEELGVVEPAAPGAVSSRASFSKDAGSADSRRYRRTGRRRRAARRLSVHQTKKKSFQASHQVAASTRIVRPSSRSTPGWKRSRSAGCVRLNSTLISQGLPGS